MVMTQDERLASKERIYKERVAHIQTGTLPLIDLKGKYRTNSLFAESYRFPATDPRIYRAKWTLNERPKVLQPSSIFYSTDGRYENVLPSFRQLYLEAADLTEYNFAIGTLGSWKHWEALCKSKFLAPLLEDWRAIVRVKLEAEALEAARKIANGPLGPTALQAAKWLHSKVSKPNGPGRGRPTKDEVRAKVKEMAQDERDIQADLARITTKVVL